MAWVSSSTPRNSLASWSLSPLALSTWPACATRAGCVPALSPLSRFRIKRCDGEARPRQRVTKQNKRLVHQTRGFVVKWAFGTNLVVVLLDGGAVLPRGSRGNRAQRDVENVGLLHRRPSHQHGP